MHHINPERIAALADEPATLPERAHLAECMDCTAELVVAQRLMRMAMTDTPTIERPLTSWERLGPALRAEGLVPVPLSGADRSQASAQSAITPIGARPARSYRAAMQAAAGLFLAVGGAVIGRASVAMPDVTGGVTATADTGFSSTAEAMSVLQHSSDEYTRAVAYLAANDSSVTLRGRDAAELYQARLDALNQSVAVTRAALYRAPQDPVLNNYYMQSVGARDLTLRQLGSITPVVATQRTRF